MKKTSYFIKLHNWGFEQAVKYLIQTELLKNIFMIFFILLINYIMNTGSYKQEK